MKQRTKKILSMILALSMLTGLLSVSSVVTPVAAETVNLTLTLNPSVKYQTVEGFGFAYGLNISAGEMNQTEWLEKIVGGLGLTMWRSGIPAGSTVPSENSEWQANRDNVLKLKEAADALGEPLRVILSAWSPPGVWKIRVNDSNNDIGGTQRLATVNEYRDQKVYHGMSTHGGTLDPDYYDDFAYYLVEVLRMYEDIGVDVYALSLQNESGFFEPYDSCIYTWEWYADLLEVCVPIIKSAYPNVLIFGAECMLEFQAHDQGWWDNFLYGKHIKAKRPEAWALLDRMATHGYSDGIASTAVANHKSLWNAQKTKYGSAVGKINWMTETSGYVNNWSAGTDQGQSALSLAIAIQTGLLYGDMAAWMWWSGHDPVDGGFCLAEGNGVTGKKWEVSKHFYRYIRPDAVRIDAKFNAEVPATLMATAYKHDKLGNNVVVFVNSGDDDYNVNVTGISGVSNWDYYLTTAAADVNNKLTENVSGSSVNIPAKSVVTLVNGKYIADAPGYASEENKDASDAGMTKQILERANYSVSAVFADTEAEAFAEAGKLVAQKIMSGVSFEITTVGFVPAVNSLDDAANVKDGYYKFTVALTKGKTSVKTKELTMQIRYISAISVPINIDASQTYQTIDGFGFIGTQETEGWTDLVVSDLGLSMWHGWIDPTNPFENDAAAVKDLADRYWAKNGKRLRAYLTVMSPPADMKVYSGQNNDGVAYNGYFGGVLDPKKYDEFCVWLNAEIKKYSDAGLTVYAIALAFEPPWAYDWQSSTNYNAAQFVDLINNVAPKIKEAYPSIKIAAAGMPLMFNLAPWAGDILQTIVRNNKNGVMDKVDIFTSNSGGSIEEWNEYYKGGSMSPSYDIPGKTHWISKDDGWGDDWSSQTLAFAASFQTNLIYGDISAWVYHTSDKLIRDELSRGNMYYTLKHFIKYIKPGAVRIDTAVADDRLVSAFKNTDGSTVIQIVNPEDSDYALDIKGKNMPKFFSYYITSVNAEDNCRFDGFINTSSGDFVIVPAKSVVTLVSDISEWVVSEVIAANERGLATNELLDGFKIATTRAEFCRAAVNFIEKYYGESIENILLERGLEAKTFADTDDAAIAAAAALGIAAGTDADKNLFSPLSTLTREQAATFLKRVLVDIIGIEVDSAKVAWADADKISSWVKNEIDILYATGIMNGTSATPLEFSPKSFYTHEQSIATFNRLWNYCGII